MTFQEEIHFMAKEYAAKGWYVIPLHSVNDDGSCTCGDLKCTDIGKHPDADLVPRGLKNGSRDLAKIDEWFARADLRNVGIVTGEISNLTVLDIDTGPGKFGAESWAEIIREHGEPQTLRAITGSGGTHLFFAYNSALKTASNVLGKNIDCRNDRGYVVAAPSKHRSGGRYAWDNWGEPAGPLPAHLSKKKEFRGRPRKDDLYRGKYTLEQVRGMLEVVPADDRDLWRYVGIILGREFKRSDEAWQLYQDWANKWEGVRGRGHDGIMHQAFYEISQEQGERELSMGTIVKAALDNGWSPKKGEVPPGHFVYYGPGNNYIYRPTGSQWIASAVDVVCSPVNDGGKLIKASDWIKEHTTATSMTSDPSIEEDYVKGINCRDGEVMHDAGAALYNTYRRPTIELGDARLAGPWVKHCEKVFNKEGDCAQFLNYMAHRVQKPWEKPRFALMIAGGQGIGKDTAVEMCIPAIGVWNVASIEPSAFESSYNDYVSSTLIRINEASNLHDMSKWAFNERTKVLIAGTPDMVRVNPKYGEQYVVRMYCGVIITTNNLATGIYIPPDDRRYDVIDCATMEEMGLDTEDKKRDYFGDLWEWFHHDGGKHIAAFLTERPLNGFSPNSGQRKTKAHREVIRINGSSDNWLDDILDGLGYPDYVRGDWITERALGMGEKKGDVLRKVSLTIVRLGYTRYDNPDTQDGRWRANGVKFVLYIKKGVVPGPDIMDRIKIPEANA